MLTQRLVFITNRYMSTCEIGVKVSLTFSRCLKSSTKFFFQIILIQLLCAILVLNSIEYLMKNVIDLSSVDKLDVTIIHEISPSDIFYFVNSRKNKTHTHTYICPLHFLLLVIHLILPQCDMKMSWTFSIVLLLVLCISSSSHAHTHGTATVDIVTFDRILHKFDTVLVKFDRKYRMYSQRKYSNQLTDVIFF